MKRAIDSSHGRDLRAALELAGGPPHVQKYLTDQIFRRGGVADDAQNEAVHTHIVTAIKDVHGRPVAVGNAFEKHIVRGRLSGNDALAGLGVDGDDVRH